MSGPTRPGRSVPAVWRRSVRASRAGALLPSSPGLASLLVAGALASGLTGCLGLSPSLATRMPTPPAGGAASDGRAERSSSGSSLGSPDGGPAGATANGGWSRLWEPFHRARPIPLPASDEAVPPELDGGF